MLIVDGHLDIAFNHQFWNRDPRLSAFEIRAQEANEPNLKYRGRCMFGMPELREGRVGIVFGTLFVPPLRHWDQPWMNRAAAYEDAAGAERLALEQMGLYEMLDQDEKGVRMIRSREDLEAVVATWDEGAAGDIGIVLLMEGADPIRTPDELPAWWERGLRIVGLSWRDTRYAGGTGAPGPLTLEGRALLPPLADAGFVLDLSHASEESFFESLDLFVGPVIASHSNPRVICDTDRQLSDPMIRAIAARDGVIGAVPFNLMLVEGWKDAGRPEVPLQRVAEAIQHIAQVSGTHHTAAIGSDFDGGFGAEAAPTGLDTVADLGHLADVLADVQFTDEMIHDILGRNWLRMLRKALPASE